MGDVDLLQSRTGSESLLLDYLCPSGQAKGGQRSMAEIIVTISKEGRPTVEVQGVPGEACFAISHAVEQAMGKVSKSEYTSEFFQQAIEQAEARLHE